MKELSSQYDKIFIFKGKIKPILDTFTDSDVCTVLSYDDLLNKLKTQRRQRQKEQAAKTSVKNSFLDKTLFTGVAFNSNGRSDFVRRKYSLNELFEKFRALGIPSTSTYWVVSSRGSAVNEITGEVFHRADYYIDVVSNIVKGLGKENNDSGYGVIYIAPCVKKSCAKKLPSLNGNGTDMVTNVIKKYRDDIDRVFNGSSCIYKDFDMLKGSKRTSVEDFVKTCEDYLGKDSPFVKYFVNRVAASYNDNIVVDDCFYGRDVTDAVREFSDIPVDAGRRSCAVYFEDADLLDRYFMIQDFSNIVEKFYYKCVYDNEYYNHAFSKMMRFIKLVDDSDNNGGNVKND